MLLAMLYFAARITAGLLQSRRPRGAVVSVLRTLLASVAILAWWCRGAGCRDRRLSCLHLRDRTTPGRGGAPAPFAAVALETADGRITDFEQLRGRWLLVDFVCSRCETYCSVQATNSRAFNGGWHSPSPRGGSCC